MLKLFKLYKYLVLAVCVASYRRSWKECHFLAHPCTTVGLHKHLSSA